MMDDNELREKTALACGWIKTRDAVGVLWIPPEDAFLRRDINWRFPVLELDGNTAMALLAKLFDEGRREDAAACIEYCTPPLTPRGVILTAIEYLNGGTEQ